MQLLFRMFGKRLFPFFEPIIGLRRTENVPPLQKHSVRERSSSLEDQFVPSCRANANVQTNFVDLSHRRKTHISPTFEYFPRVPFPAMPSISFSVRFCAAPKHIYRKQIEFQHSVAIWMGCLQFFFWWLFFLLLNVLDTHPFANMRIPVGLFNNRVSLGVGWAGELLRLGRPAQPCGKEGNPAQLG